MIEYEIKRSKRKTIAIHIMPDGKIEVRCPNRVSAGFIYDFVKSKENWINKHLAVVNNRVKTPLAIGGEMLYLGKRYPILETKSRPFFDGEAFRVQKDADIYAVLSDFYRSRALDIIPRMVRELENVIGLYADGIRITSAKTRWGSCGAKNSLNFSWMLMMAEPNVIRYVVIHELSHIKEKNHGKRFYAIVEKYEPRFKEYEKKLRHLAEELRCDGWM